MKASLRVAGKDEADAKKDVKMDTVKDRPVPCGPSAEEIEKAKSTADSCLRFAHGFSEAAASGLRESVLRTFSPRVKNRHGRTK